MTVEEAKQLLAQNPIRVDPEAREVLVRDMGEQGYRKLRLARVQEQAENIRVTVADPPALSIDLNAKRSK